MSDDRRLLDVALRVVADACHVARTVQAGFDRVRQITKDDRSPVSVADFAVQAVVALGLQTELGEAIIVGEEHAQALRTADQAPVREAVLAAVRGYRPDASEDEVLDAIDHCDHDASASAYWTLDPIDGTKGFLRGQQYAIALARIEAGAVTLGVLGCPNLPADPAAPLDRADPTGTIYAATRTSGGMEFSGCDLCAARPVRAGASQPGRPIRVCESVEAGHSSAGDADRVLALLREEGVAAGEPARLDSQCKYAVVARGQADAYLRMPTKKAYIEKVWDHAAGALIAQRAGAVVSDIAGQPLDFSRGRLLEGNRGVICAVAGLHERIIAAIERLGIASAGKAAV